MTGVMRAFAGGVLLFAMGCEEAPAAPTETPRAVWACPAGWVVGARGGCGPAALLCAPDGGAMEGACAASEVAHPPPIAAPDGGTLAGLRPLPDGGIAGAWSGADEGGSAVTPGITTCPEGWSRAADGTCDPALRADCPEGSAALPGGGCTRTAERDCPEGEYPEASTDFGGAVVHVRVGANTFVADGSPERPFATVGDGLSHIGHFGHVLVARGVYRERLRVPEGRVEVAGVCAARVTVDGSLPAESPDTAVSTREVGTTLLLRGVTVRSRGSCLYVHVGATLIASEVALLDCVSAGAYGTGAGSRLELSSSLVRGVTSGATAGQGHGLQVSLGATLRATGVVVEEATGLGVIADGEGSDLEFDGSVVRGTRKNALGNNGVGLTARLGATLTAHAVVVEENLQAGVTAEGGAHVEIDGAIVRGTREADQVAAGDGLSAGSGSTLHARNVLVDDNVRTGALASEAGTTLEISSSVVRNTRPERAFGYGNGLAAHVGATLRATGVSVENSTLMGVTLTGAGTLAELTDCAVRDTLADPRSGRGFGVVVNTGASLRATRTVFERNVAAGVAASDPGTEAWLSGCVVRDTRPDPRGVYGRGLGVQGGASVHVAGSLLAESTEVAAFVNGAGSRVEGSDLVIAGVHPAVGGFGLGVEVGDGARFDGARVAVVSVGGAAIIALPCDARSQVRIDDLFVRNVRPSTVLFDDNGGVGFPSGPTVAYGLHAGAGCSIEAARAVIDTGDYGVFNASGTVRVRVGVIARQRQAIGAFDLGTPAGATELIGVSSVDNVRASLTRRDDLPTAASLAAPPDPCAEGCE